jgi:hypothetical protein
MYKIAPVIVDVGIKQKKNMYTEQMGNTNGNYS